MEAELYIKKGGCFEQHASVIIACRCCVGFFPPCHSVPSAGPVNVGCDNCPVGAGWGKHTSTGKHNSTQLCFLFHQYSTHMHVSFVCRRFGTKCAGCLQGISPSDLVRKARSKVFHLNCFTCMVCNKQLSTGEELYVIDENKFVCKEDYLTSGAIKEVNLNSGEEN